MLSTQSSTLANSCMLDYKGQMALGAELGIVLRISQITGITG